MLYAIQAVGTAYVKIGVTCRPSIGPRLRQLQNGNPNELVVLATVQWLDSDERLVLRYLSGCRVRGEWFRLCEQSQTVIDAMRKGKDGRAEFIAMLTVKVPSTHRRLGRALDLCIAINPSEVNVTL